MQWDVSNFIKFTNISIFLSKIIIEIQFFAESIPEALSTRLYCNICKFQFFFLCIVLFLFLMYFFVFKVECSSDIHMLSVNREGQEDLTVKIWAKLDNPF